MWRLQQTLPKCSERVCGIVEGGGVLNIRNKRGWGREGWSVWLQVGSKPGLETVQGFACHNFLGQAVPFGDGPEEE